MTFRTEFIVALRAAGVPDGLVLDALLAAEASERMRRAAARATRMNEADPMRPEESPSAMLAPVTAQSVGGPVKDRARRGLALAPELRPASRAVGAVLIERCNLTSGRCDPGIADIAGKTGLSARSVRRALADLDARGLFARVVHGGRRHANAYRPNWDALGGLGVWPSAKVNEADSGATRTLVAADPDSRVRQNLQGNIKPPVREERSRHGREPDHRQRSFALMAVIPGRAAVSASSAEQRVWSDVHSHFSPHGPKAVEAVTLRLMQGGLGERAALAEQSRRGDGLRMVLQVLKEAG